MKPFLGFFIFLTVSFSASSQNILQAIVKGDKKYFDYEDYVGTNQPIGDLIFLKGCNWYCAGYVSQVYASSELLSNGDIDYTAKNAHDFNKATAWVEGRPGYGIGEAITYIFDYSDKPKLAGKLGINKLLIANGYKKSRKLWKANSRVKRLKVLINDNYFADIELVDSFEIQVVEFPTIMFNNERKEIKFIITDVYPGIKYKDTAISLLMFDGVGDH